jgi:uncharacterized protein (TIGR00730 family)
MSNSISKVCVYGASSRQVNHKYLEAAYQLGSLLAKNRVSIVYGGGAVGCMGALADGAISQAGQIIGILPRFMYDLEWAHPKLNNLEVVNDLPERKQKMIAGVDAVLALPGGSGTLEELLEAITWKRLGLYLNPIILLNVSGFFNSLLKMLEYCIKESFMDERHRAMWSTIEDVEQVLPAIENAPGWSADSRHFAAI